MFNRYQQISNIKLIKGIWKEFKGRRKKQFSFICLFMIISSFLETFSLASIIPLINFLISPNDLWRESYIQSFASFLNLNNPNEIIFPITLFFIITVLIASVFRIITLWVISRFSALIGNDFSYESYKKNLYQPYSIHIEKNSAEVVAINGIKIQVIINTVNDMLRILLSLTFTIFILSFLLIYDLKLGILSFSIFSLFYFLISYFSRFILYKNSKFVSKARTNHVKFLNETLGSIKDILLNNNYKFYLRIFSNLDRKMRLKMSQIIFISSFPRAAIESIAFIYIAFLALYIVINESNSVLILSKFAIIVVGCQKLLPQLQQIYASWTRIKGSSKSIEEVLDTLKQNIQMPLNNNNQILIFDRFIHLKSVFFRYKGMQNNLIKGVDLKILKNEKIGIIGETGTGKTTLIDLIIGLITPTQGKVFIDKSDLSDINKLQLWRSSISYIPQNIYLSDASILENIACGLNFNDVNIEDVIKASKKARIHDFIIKLPYGYNTEIGEMGLKLSGGQRQRIGIARSIFNIFNSDKKLLVLDEATSALNTEVEDSVINELYKMDKLTIIMVSHRYNTLRKCDRILKIKDGLIEDQGDPQKILSS